MKITHYSGNPASGLPDTTNITDPQLRLFLDRIKAAVTRNSQLDVDALADALMRNGTFRKKLDKVITVAAGKVAKDTTLELLDNVASPAPGGDNQRKYIIAAQHAWCNGNSTVYTENASPEAGDFYFDAATVSGEFDSETDYYDAKSRLAAGRIAGTEEKEFIVAENIERYWRNEEIDGNLTIENTIPVNMLMHPMRVTPADEHKLYWNPISTVDGGTTGALYSKCCPTQSPTPAQAKEFTVSKVTKIAAPGLTWQNIELPCWDGRYHEGYEEGNPILRIDSAGGTVPGAGDYFDLTVYKTPDYITPSYSIYYAINDAGDSYTSTGPMWWSDETEDYGMNTDGAWTSVRRENFLVIDVDGILYNSNYTQSGGYVFDGLNYAEAWEKAPCFGGGTVYTQNQDGESKRDAAYEFADFTGNTYSITAGGTGTYSITTESGATYYNVAAQ